MNTEKNLHVALLQTDLVWENPAKNIANFQNLFSKLPLETNLVVLPEMFSTGFSMNAEKLAEPMNGETVRWMQQMASKYTTAIVGSLIILENNNYYNRLLFVHPNGKIQYYDKRHTFSLANEHKVYTKGNDIQIIDYLDWKICPFICYDLRFPVWSRNTSKYDLLIYVASWPKTRINAWDALLKARAIENMTYTIGVNRIGIDANGYEYIGHSNAYDFLGKSLGKNSNNKESIITITLDKKIQNETRNKLGFLDDADQFMIQ